MVAVTVGDLTRTALVVPASVSCDQVDLMFRSARSPSCVAVTDGDRVGMIMRETFSALMSGPFGYGRTLWARRPIGEVTDWSPLRIEASATVVAAAQRMRSRTGDNRHDDVLVDRLDGTVGRASSADLFDALARQYSYRAVHDDLTGLVNRTHFLELLTAACADPAGGSVMLAVVDVDGMKRINDSYGHLVGDAVLIRVARHLDQTAGPGELVARLGADEFVVLSRSGLAGREPASAAAELADRCRLALSAPDGSGHPGVTTRASVGVAVSGRRADAATLLSEADMAMFRAKQAGGDQIQITVDVEAHLALDVDLVDRSVADAIHDDELEVWYQPVTRIRDHAVVNIEALVRWRHPQMGLLSPDRFLPGARRAGHLPALDAWVLTRACSDFVALHQRLGTAAPARVAVNLAPATLGTDFDDLVASVLAATGLAAHLLLLELPEDADLATLAEAAPRLERLRGLGVGLILDDMGAGSTSLRHLSTLTIGGLKIDAAFIAGMLHNPRDRTVVKLLADLGRGLDLPVTAEGVETADQLAALADLDIDYAQGYHLGRPEPLDHLAARLNEDAVAIR
jgi:diguanylate cyclase (GGDEF)-like protein